MSVSLQIALLVALVLISALGIWRHSVTASVVLTAIVAATLWFPFSWIHRIILMNREARRILRAAGSLCVQCGYDLRASPDVCPECGTPVPRVVLPRTPAVERLDSQARAEAARAGDDYVGTEHLLLAMLRDKDSAAAALLEQCGVDADSIADCLGEAVSDAPPPPVTSQPAASSPRTGSRTA